MDWKGKSVLVTGGAGFIGSHLCRALRDAGARTVSLDNYIMGSKENHHHSVEYCEGHTKDISRHILGSIDIIFHLGEYSRVEASFEEPALVWDLNVAGTFAVAEFWRQQNLDHSCKLVYAGSSTKFADGGSGRNQSPYAWTKANNTELIRNYADWFSLPYAITYFYNVYGPGERADRYGTVVEIFRQKKMNGEALTVVAPGTQLRNFTHVNDIVDGLLLVGEKGFGDEFGLGAPESYSVLEIATMFEGEIVMLPERKGNRMTAELDTAKSAALGWSPKRKILDYIREVLKN